MEDRDSESYLEEVNGFEINVIARRLYLSCMADTEDSAIDLATSIYMYARNLVRATSCSYQEAVDILLHLITPDITEIVSVSEALRDLGLTAMQAGDIFDDCFRSMKAYENRLELKSADEQKQWRMDTRLAVPNKSLGHFNRPGNPKYYGKTRRKDRYLREES